MKFEVESTLGARVVGNEELAEIVCDNSSMSSDQRVKLKEKLIRYLEYTGAIERRWLSRDQNSYDTTMENIAVLLNKTSTRAKDIDAVVFVGVHKPFAEPANACFIARHFAMKPTHVFDFTEACQSWMRGCFMVGHILKPGKKALIVSSEFNMGKGQLFTKENASFSSLDDFTHLFASTTIGEATSATLISNEEMPNRNENWLFESMPELADLCFVGNHGSEDWRQPGSRLSINGHQLNQFISFGKELHLGVQPYAVKLMQEFREESRLKRIDKIFTHGSSSRMWDTFSTEADINPALIHHIYPTTGNLVSSSIPVALDHAIKEGFDHNNQNFVFWCGSAGASVGSYGNYALQE